MATPLYLAELVVYDPSAGGLTTLRYASGAGHVTGPAETPANTFYDARIKQPVTIRRDLFSAGKLGGRSRVGYGDLVLHNGDGGVDALLGYALQGRAVTIRRGTPGAAYPSGFTTIFSGTMEQAEAVGDTLVVKLRDKQLDLMVPLQTTKFAGSNSLPDGVEGVEGDLKGKSKPVCLGQVFNVPVPCVNTAKLIYQVADRSVTVDAVYDAGIPLLAGFPLTARTHGFSAYGIFGIAYGADTFVAVGLAGRIETSPDGTTWTVRTSGFGSESISAVAFGNGLFVAVGLGGALATSPDGITWTARTSSFGTDPIGAVAYGNGQWVATGYAGKIATSPDGITWTQQTNPFSASDYLFLLAYGNGRWIAASIDAMATSVDGATWALGTSGFAVGQYHQAVAYGGGLFILAGTSGLLSTSPDGITWTARSPGFGTDSIKGTYYGQGLGSLPPGWVIVGENGRAATSTDGINWTTLTSGQSGAFLNAVAFGDGRFVVIGTSGAGAGLIASSGGGPSYGSLADLQDEDATPEAGTFRAYSGAEGTYIRLGASPYGQVTADATEGTNAAARTAGQLFVKVLQRAGKATGDWSASDVTALDTANSAVLGDWFMGDDTFADVLDRIATTVGAWWGADADGVYRIQQLTAPSGTAVYAATANDLLRPLARLAISDDTKGLPSWRSILRYKRNYAVQPGAGGAGGASSPATAGGPWLDVNDMVLATGSTTPRSVRDRFAEVFNVMDFGAVEGATEATQHAEINAAIVAANAAGGGVVVVPPGVWMVDPDKAGGAGVELLDNVTLWLMAGATLRSIATGLDLYGVVWAVGRSNVAVIGTGSIDGNRAAHIGTTGESGMCLWFAGCDGVKVRDIQCINGWGDGIYLGDNGTTPNTNVDLFGVVCDGNRRQGCSVVGVQGGRIVSCAFLNTNGTAPQAGIDLEPNTVGNVDGVIVSDCIALDNAGAGFLMTTSSKNSRIHHCYSARNAKNGISVAATGGGNVVDHCTVADLTASTRGAIDVASGTIGCRLLGNTVRNITTGNAGYYVHSTATGIEVTDNHAKSVTGGADAFTIAAPDTIVHNNTAEDCGGIGLDVATSGDRCSITANTAIRCVGRGFYLAGDDCLVEGNTALDISTVSGGMFQFVGVGAQAIGNRAILTTPDTAIVPFLFTGAAAIKIGNLGIGTQAYTEALVGTLSTAAQPNVTSLGTLTSLTVSGTLAAGVGQFGTNPASAGTIKIPNNVNISARNAANTGDLRLLSASAGDNGNYGSADLTNLVLAAGASGLWLLLGATGVFGPNTDNTYDIGASAANRPRTGYFGTSVVTKRFVGAGTAHVAGDYALSAGWGATGAVSAIAARDTGGRVSITPNGAGIAANPTVTLTFKDGTWTTIPALALSRGDAVAPAGGYWALTTPSATAPVFTFVGTPVAGSVYVLDFVTMGK